MAKMIYTEEQVLQKMSKYVASNSFKATCQASIELMQKGCWSNLIEYETSKGDKKIAKVKLKKHKDGNIGIDFRFQLKEAKIADEMTYNNGKISISEDDREKLLKGDVLLKDMDNGKKVLTQLDKDTNQMTFFMQEWIKLPDSIYDRKLTPEDKDNIINGDKVDFQLPLKDGEKEVQMYYSPADGRIRFEDKSDDAPLNEVQVEQEQKIKNYNNNLVAKIEKSTNLENKKDIVSAIEKTEKQKKYTQKKQK